MSRADSSEIRIGVVGVGPRAIDTWLPLMQKIPGYRIVGLCDALPSRAWAARAHVAGDVRIWPAFSDVLADRELDAIALTARSPVQGQMAAEALRAGLHVHSEVPAAFTLDDCAAIVEAARTSRRVYCLAEQTRYWGFVEAWKELRSAGKLGVPLLAEGQYFHYLPGSKFMDERTGEYVPLSARDAHSVPTWQQKMSPILYLPHELSPLLKILDDRVATVVAMSTPTPSRAHPEIAQSDMQVAMMQTARGTILRVAASFASPHPEGDWHWYQVVGTAGAVEWRRSRTDSPKQWFVDGSSAEPSAADWGFARPDAPESAKGSGHGDADYYVHAAFRDAVLGGVPPEMSVIDAVNTAAPAIVAAQSISAGGAPLNVPQFDL